MLAPSADEVAAWRAAGIEDVDSVLDLTTRLVRIPSRGGIDSYTAVLAEVGGWLDRRGLQSRHLVDDAGRCVGVTCLVDGSRPGARWVLDACIDTAPFGDESKWRLPPTSGALVEGRLHGRGSADSKVAVAIFCHVAARIAAMHDRMCGQLALLFDADEHTGGFAGARTYFDQEDPCQIGGVLIGYPGLDKLVVGSRGVLRAEIHVHGVSGHSGSRARNINAVEKAAELVTVLSEMSLPSEATPAFPVGPKVTVTAINGGEGFSTVPDLCVLRVDMRTTPRFDAADARTLLSGAVAGVDERWPTTPSTDVTIGTDWPAYTLGAEEPLRTAMIETATSLGLELTPTISGPSNIGNYLAGRGIPATAGFGVAYAGLHGTDEQIDISTIATVEAVYLGATMRLLGL